MKLSLNRLDFIKRLEASMKKLETEAADLRKKADAKYDKAVEDHKTKMQALLDELKAFIKSATVESLGRSGDSPLYKFYNRIESPPVKSDDRRNNDYNTLYFNAANKEKEAKRLSEAVKILKLSTDDTITITDRKDTFGLSELAPYL